MMMSKVPDVVKKGPATSKTVVIATGKGPGPTGIKEILLKKMMDMGLMDQETMDKEMEGPGIPGDIEDKDEEGCCCCRCKMQDRCPRMQGEQD
jgi:hypothetical protein